MPHLHPKNFGTIPLYCINYSTSTPPPVNCFFILFLINTIFMSFFHFFVIFVNFSHSCPLFARLGNIKRAAALLTL